MARKIHVLDLLLLATTTVPEVTQERNRRIIPRRRLPLQAAHFTHTRVVRLYIHGIVGRDGDTTERDVKRTYCRRRHAHYATTENQLRICEICLLHTFRKNERCLFRVSGTALEIARDERSEWLRGLSRRPSSIGA
jgi:hypothetical protein